MKYFVRHLFVGLVIFALAGLMAVGKEKTKRASVTVPTDFTVNGTPVKAGDYDLKFDEQTGELDILKGGKLVAKTTAHLQDRAGDAHGTSMHFKDNALVSVAFGHQEAVVAEGNSATGNEQ